MNDERFEKIMRDAAHTYRRVPEPIPVDQMWADIEQQAFDGGAPRDARPPRTSPFGLLTHPWLRAAAFVLIGLGIGRMSVRPVADVALVAPAADEFAMSAPDAAVAGTYLDEATALLAALPVDVKAAKADVDLVSNANDLLMQTRRLLDAGTMTDPALHALLEDLELVLVQVVRLQAAPDAMKLDLLEQSLENRDVLPRLRSAIAHHSADDN